VDPQRIGPPFGFEVLVQPCAKLPRFGADDGIDAGVERLPSEKRTDRVFLQQVSAAFQRLRHCVAEELALSGRLAECPAAKDSLHLAIDRFRRQIRLIHLFTPRSCPWNGAMVAPALWVEQPFRTVNGSGLAVAIFANICVSEAKALP
jgi:hypothetical protein